MIFVTLVVVISAAIVQDVSAQTKLYDLYSGSVSVDFSPDGKYIATGDTDGDVGLWEVSSGENIYYRSLGGVVRGVAFSPDGRYIAADGAGSVRAILLEASSGTEVQRTDLVDEADDINSVTFSPNGQYVALGDDTGRAYLWNLNDHYWTSWTHREDEIFSVAFSPNGEYLATGDSNGYANLWEVSSWWTDDVNVQRVELGGNVRAVAFSPNGRYLAADGYDGSNTNVTIYDLSSVRSVRQIDPDVFEVQALAFSPDGRYLAVGGYDPEAIIFYRIGTEEITLTTQITREKTIQVSGEVHDLAWSPDGDLISDGRAVYRMLLNSPKIVLESQEIDDDSFGWSEGNANGVVEVGEQITFTVTLRNEGDIEAENVKGTLSAENRSSESIIFDGEVDYGNIGVGRISSGGPFDYSFTSEDPQRFKLKIPLILTSQDATFTLTVTADNGGPWTIPITVPISNPANIGIAFPEDLISEEAFGTHSTYFILKVKHPTLTGISATEAYYQNCEITLHIPDGTQAFMFPIQTQGEKTAELLADVVISIGGFFLEGPTLLISIIEFYERFRDLLERDLKIEIPGSLSTPGRPNTEIEYVVLLKNETRTLNSLDITIKQTYRLGESPQRYEVQNTSTWNFSEGWAAARAAHPLALSDYPPFQLLPLEVRQYLLRQFSAFETAEASRIPAKTVVAHNYPNPFNPETWISYQLAESSEVTVSIYSVDGRLVRRLALGYQTAGVYQGKSRAAYWDGLNEFGEHVASGVYFYTFVAGNFSAAGKMLMMK